MYWPVRRAGPRFVVELIEIDSAFCCLELGSGLFCFTEIHLPRRDPFGEAYRTFLRMVAPFCLTLRAIPLLLSYIICQFGRCFSIACHPSRKRLYITFLERQFPYICSVDLSDLCEASEIAAFDEKKKLVYIADEMTERDYQHDMYWSHKKGFDAGITSVVRAMLSRGMSVEKIVECTGLSEEQVLALSSN